MRPMLTSCLPLQQALSAAHQQHRLCLCVAPESFWGKGLYTVTGLCLIFWIRPCSSLCICVEKWCCCDKCNRGTHNSWLCLKTVLCGNCQLWKTNVAWQLQQGNTHSWLCLKTVLCGRELDSRLCCDNLGCNAHWERWWTLGTPFRRRAAAVRVKQQCSPRNVARKRVPFPVPVANPVLGASH